jgi:hypothetical protein
MVDTALRIFRVSQPITAGAAVSVKLFISCVSDEFRTYRDQLANRLRRPNVEVIVQEDFKDQGEATVANDDVYIQACDAVIHLAGDMTGFLATKGSIAAILAKYPDITEKLPPLRELLERGEQISYTHWEAWLALYHGKPLLIADAAESAPRGPRFAPTDASRAAQRAHLDRLRAIDHHPGCTFASADQLIAYVLASPVLDLLAEERSNAATRDAGALPYVIFAGVVALVVTLPWTAESWMRTLQNPLAGLLAMVSNLGGGGLALVYLRYFGVLGASEGPTRSRDRKGYDALRENLATGGPGTHLYARWLEGFLNKVDGFFGDADMADRTLLPHAFGLKAPAPLWTASAFDRCLWLAMIYPFATILIVWAVSNHVGPAEAVLGLTPDIADWRRGLVIGIVGFSIATFNHWKQDTEAWRHDSTAIPAEMLVGFAFWIAFNFAGLDGFSVDGPFMLFMMLGFVRLGVTGVGFSTFGHALDIGGTGAIAAAICIPTVGIIFPNPVTLFLVYVFICAVSTLNAVASRIRRQGIFLVLYLSVVIIVCICSAYSLSNSKDWKTTGPWLLFLVLLTLLNAPFDWASLGLTRALLRRGLELKGWWPFFLAVADAMAAAVIIALLALTMVIGVQTFDALAIHGGGKAVLPLGPVFDGIAAHPELPEYWWVYALLLSTMIPSLVNLAIGGTALMRAVPGLSPALLHFLPATGGVPVYDRAWIAAVLTVQAALGAVLGVAVQTLIAWGLIFHAMPAVGRGLLDLARDLAALNLPMRLIEFVAGAPH